MFSIIWLLWISTYLSHFDYKADDAALDALATGWYGARLMKLSEKAIECVPLLPSLPRLNCFVLAVPPQ